MFSHPSDAAAPTVKGYKVINIYPNEDGLPDVQALKKAVSNRTAGLLITNPEDTGIFNPKIKEFTQIVHDSGGPIEFVPKNDSQVEKLLSSREDIFPHYDQQHFEEDFSSHFDILEQTSIPHSERTIYLMKRK